MAQPALLAINCTSLTLKTATAWVDWRGS